MIFKGIDMDRYFKDYPDEFGYFGKYGGVYITEELKNAMQEIRPAKNGGRIFLHTLPHIFRLHLSKQLLFFSLALYCLSHRSQEHSCPLVQQ